MPIDVVDNIKQHYYDDNKMTEAYAETMLYKWPKKINSLRGDQSAAGYDVTCDDVSALIADISAHFIKKAPILGVL